MAEIRFESYYGVAPLDGNYLMHSGVKGQKWYHRRYQHEDGSLTPLGRIHYGVGPARDKAITDKDRQIRQEKKRVAYSSKMQKKHNLIDVPTNRDAAIDNARDMYRRGASNDEIKKYLKLNRLPNDAVGDIVREGNEYRANQKAKTAIKELERKQAEKQEKAAAKREKFLETANARQLKSNLKDLSLDELRQIKRDSAENKQKIEVLNDIVKERRLKIEAKRDLKAEMKDPRIEYKKKMAIDSGDPTLIKKYAKTMTTDELRAAIDRVNKINDVNRLSDERIADNKARKEALYADIQEKVGGLGGIVNYYRKSKKSNKDLKISEIMKAYNEGKHKATEVTLKGAAKDAYEKYQKDKTAQEASRKYDDMIKKGASTEAANKSVMELFAKRLNGVSSEDKSEKKVKDLYNENLKSATSKAANEARKQAEKEGKSQKETEKSVMDAIRKLVNPTDEKPKKREEKPKEAEALKATEKSKETEKTKDSTPISKLKNIITSKGDTPSIKSSLFKQRVDRSDKEEVRDYNKGKSETIANLKRNNTILRAKSLQNSGMTVKEIAKSLGISESTVSEYLKKK